MNFLSVGLMVRFDFEYLLRATYSFIYDPTLLKKRSNSYCLLKKLLKQLFYKKIKTSKCFFKLMWVDQLEITFSLWRRT